MPEISPSKYLVEATWEDVPHLTDADKGEIIASTPPYLRDARSKGLPSMGAGAIYPIELTEVTTAPIEIPAYWPRGYALDVGWKKTAALWGAWDRSSDILYGYTEHYRGQAEPSIHATAIKARGEWIPGVIDPAARGRSQHDGEQLMAQYQALGLVLNLAKTDIESGLFAVWERLSTGRLKLFNTLLNTQAEYRLYRRDEKGQIVKQFDHLMDCLRYLVMALSMFKVQPVTSVGMKSTGFGDPKAGY